MRLEAVNWVRWLVSGVLCGAVVAGAVGFLIRQAAEARSKAARDAPARLREARAKRRNRRRYGAVLVIVLAAIFFVALNLLDPAEGAGPHATLGVYTLVLLLLVVLVILALADVRQTLTDRTLREAEMNQHLIEALARHVRKQRKAAKTPDASQESPKTAAPPGRDGGNGQDH